MLQSILQQGQAPAKKLVRSKPYIDERGKREYRGKKIESKNKYGVLRSQPMIVEIIKNALSKNLSQGFDKIGSHNQDMISQAESSGRLIVFVLGGLSINEVTAV